MKVRIKQIKLCSEGFEKYLKSLKISKKDLNQKDLREKYINDYMLTIQNQIEIWGKNFKERCENEDIIFEALFYKYR